MGRPIRIHFPGAVYHAMSRGNGGQDIFLDNEDRQKFLMSLAGARSTCHFKIYAYCLMSNHFHLLVKVATTPLALVMQALLTQYASYFNQRRATTGHLFQSRYKAILCTDDAYLLTLLRYIHQNPVKAGFVSDPIQWPWSSHREYLHPSADHLTETTFPLSILHERPDTARSLLRDLVNQPMRIGPRPDEPPPPHDGAEAVQIDHDLAEDEDEETIETLETVAESVSRETGSSLSEMRGRRRDGPVAASRRYFIRRALAAGFRAAEIARFLGRSKALITKYGHVEKSELLRQVNV